MSLLPLIVCCILCLTYAESCGLGYLVSSIQADASGDFHVKCSAHPDAGCPMCQWTNMTCKEHSKAHHWGEHGVYMANVTNVMPAATKKKSLSSPGATSPKAQPFNPNYRKTFGRRCCLTNFIRAGNCRFAKIYTSNKAFDVTDFAKSNLKCSNGKALIKDLTEVEKGKQYNIEVCCLEQVRAKIPGVCIPPRPDIANAAGAATAIALGVALGAGLPVVLALGIRPAAPQACSDPTIQCCATVFSGYDFGGSSEKYCKDVDFYREAPIWNDNVLSIKITTCCEVEVFDNDNYSPPSIVYQADAARAGKVGFYGVSSMRIRPIRK